MYNSTPVFKGGYSITSDTKHPIIDTSHFLTIPRANQRFAELQDVYVNEIGDDSKNGILDMKNNKIINLPNPNRNTDASNKFYVDDSIIKATKNYSVLITELDKLQKDLLKKQENINKLGAQLKKYHDADVAKLNEFDKTYNERIIRATNAFRDNMISVDRLIKDIRAELGKVENVGKSHAEDLIKVRAEFSEANKFLNLLPRQYGFMLDIGPHLSVVNVQDKHESIGKITKHEITFPFIIIEKRLHLQHTLIAETNEWKDDISSHIRSYKLDISNLMQGKFAEVSTSKLTIELYTFRSNGTHHWGIHLHAYLLVSLFNDVIPVIKDSSTSP